jgi:hypothetical protein
MIGPTSRHPSELTCQGCKRRFHRHGQHRQRRPGRGALAPAGAPALPSEADERIRNVRLVERVLRLVDQGASRDALGAAEARPHGLLASLLGPAQEEGDLGSFAGCRVLKTLGAGGMGLVLEAHDPVLDRRLALKVIHPDAGRDRERVSRFFREARAAAGLTHDHILPPWPSSWRSRPGNPRRSPTASTFPPPSRT